MLQVAGLLFEFMGRSAHSSQSDLPQTRAELTNYQETSTYEDVIKFMRAIESKYPDRIRYETIGASAEGRKIPMITLASPMVKDANAASKSGKLIIYIQANIHAGEVEGKEACLMLLRKYVNDPDLLKKAIFKIQPIYNADGNEKFGPQSRNRPGQNGPEQVGLRPNGQGYDLNRDCTKARSPEMQAALQHVYSWKPHVVFDLHTTDGTRHGYPLTYGGSTSPNIHPELAKYNLDWFFPQVRKTLQQSKLETFDYGNAVQQNGKWRFESFSGDPRFVTNYGGFRHAVTILSEAIVYDTFRDRVMNTYRFVEACREQIIKDSDRIRKVAQQSRRERVRPGTLLATRLKLKLRGQEPILMEKSNGTRRTGPITDIETVSMDVYDRFEGSEFRPMPAAYILPELPETPEILEKLRLHGIQVGPLQTFDRCEVFNINQFKQAATPFQGVKLIELNGEWVKSSTSQRGYQISTQQENGRLIFELLEPACLDGFVAWDFFKSLKPDSKTYPVFCVR